ncbi:hypothetical protein AAE478_001098 [Parahypoxylon ruwenzoriense]
MLIIESTPSAKEELLGASDTKIQRLEEEENGVPKWKGKENAIVKSKGDGSGSTILLNDQATVDWNKYEPPAGLKNTADSMSEVVTQIVQESIDKIKARVAEEEEILKAEDKATELRQEEELRQESEKGKSAETPNTPLIGKPREQVTQLEPLPLVPGAVGSHGVLAPERATKSKKNSLMNLFRRLNNVGKKGESSAAGAARHKRDISWGQNELGTRITKKRPVPDTPKSTATNSNNTPTSSVHEPEVECVSCLEDFSPKDMVKAPCHSYCKPCFLRLISTTCKNEQQWPPKCCLNPIPATTITLNVDNKLKQIYQEKAAEWDIPVGDRIYCSSSRCSVWIRPHQIKRGRNVARCSEGHWTCTICRGAQHKGDNCPQDRDMMRTNELAEQEGWKRCYGCHAYVEHREACQHMTCRCGAEFCYVCGARWRTCTCSMEQLDAIKREADTRRQVRQVREAQEEAEIQEALRLVEEFEREEALKAVLLQEEQQRLAEEQRQKKLEEQIRRETKRRQAVEAKFQELREVLANVHELQRVIVMRDHAAEEIHLEMQGIAALGSLQEKQKADRERLNAETSAKLAKRETALGREYATRVAEERRLEEQYRVVLEGYWTGKKDGEAKMEASLKEFKRNMDEGFRKWEKWRDNDLDNYRWSAREEQAIQIELMEEAERRLARSTREEQRAFALRKAAELRWVDVVIEERSRMLNDMEVDEIDNGEDVEAWFAEDELEDGVVDELDFQREYRVPGAFP